MRFYIVFSLFIVTTCAASLGSKDEFKVSTTSSTTTEAALHSDVHKPELESEPEIVGVEKLEEAIETVKEENSNDVSNVGVNTLEAFKTVLSSNELKDASSKANASETQKIPEITKSGDSGTKDTKEHVTANHIHTRQTNQLLGAGSEIIQNGGLFGINNGLANGGIVTTERLIGSGELLNKNGGIIGTGNLLNNGKLIRQENVVYNQGLSGIGTGGLITTGELLNSGQLVNTGRIFETSGNQIINSGGIVGSSGLGSGKLIQSGQLIGSGIQGTNNAILTNNYQIGNLGNQAIRSSVAGERRITIGLDELNSVPQTVEYSKQFYHFEAPEEQQESGQITKQLSNVLKKNLQVIFINAPENTATTNAALQLAKQAIEQRTAIYVLSKEADANQLIGQLEQIQENVQTAPEVRIIKYRTPEDLERAKLEIQAQYETTGGSTESFNGGVVPVLNYASNKEAYTGFGIVPDGVVSSRYLGNVNHGESSNVVSSIGSLPKPVIGQNTVSGQQAFLGSSIGQLNVIKGGQSASTVLGSGQFSTVAPNVYNVNTVIKTNPVATGLLIGSNSGSIQSSTISPPSVIKTETQKVFTTSGSNKYFGTGPLITPSLSSGISAGYTRELGSNSIAPPISKLPVNRRVSVVTTGNSASGSGLIDSYNSNVNDRFGPSSQNALSGSSLIGSSSGISNYIVDNSKKTESLVGTVKPTVGSSFNTEFSKTISKTVSNSGPSQILSSGNFDSGTNLGTSGVVGSGLGTGLSSGSLQGSNLGAQFSSSSFGSESLQGSNSGSKISVIKFETGSSNTVGSESGLESITKTTASTGLPVKPSVGSYASKVTIDSSKIDGPATKSNSELNGVNVLSSTHIDSGLNGSQESESKKIESSSEYVSGLGIGSSIGELVKKEDVYIASSTEKVLAVEKPTVNRKYLPPVSKKY